MKKPIAEAPQQELQSWQDVMQLNFSETAGELNLTALALGLVPHVGDAVNLATAGADTKKAKLEARQKMEEILGIDLRKNAFQSKAARKELADEDAEIGSSVERTATGIGAGMAAAKLGSMVFPLGMVTGGIIGIGGALLGEKGYDLYKASVQSADDKELELAAKIRLAQLKGIEVPPEALFVAAVAGMPLDERKKITTQLKALSRNKYKTLSEALEAGDVDNLQYLMHTHDDAVSVQLGRPTFNDKNIQKTASEVAADLVNQGAFNARDLVLNRDPLNMVLAELEADKLKASGVTVADDDAPLAPIHNGSNRFGKSGGSSKGKVA